MDSIALVKQFEGCALAPYQDVAGYWTIGWGSCQMPNGAPVTAYSSPLTQEEADALLAKRVGQTQAAVAGLVHVPLTVAQLGSLTSFAYNEGLHAFATSTLLRLLNAGDYIGAARQFTNWDVAGGRVIRGLVNRRSKEADNFLNA